MSGFRFYNHELNPTVTRRRLPHWEQPEVCYFLTFRTADSLPAEVTALFRAKRIHWLQCKGVDDSHDRPWNEVLSRLPHDLRKEFRREFSKEFHELLDSGYGECWLRDPETRGLVEEALHHGKGVNYLLGDYVIMPNHVHVLVQPTSGQLLRKIVGSWKKYSARVINQLRQTSGSFWQAESFDRIVRDEREFARYRDYIAENPVKARLPAGSYSLYRCLWDGE